MTRRKDFLAAGLARIEEVQQGDRIKKRIVTEDAQGRVIDLHAMRTTLGTTLARRGVAPQIAQQIMRHRDYRTTLKHYTALSLADAAKGMEEVPTIGRSEGARGPQIGPHSVCDSAHPDASACQNGTREQPIAVSLFNTTRKPFSLE